MREPSFARVRFFVFTCACRKDKRRVKKIRFAAKTRVRGRRRVVTGNATCLIKKDLARLVIGGELEFHADCIGDFITTFCSFIIFFCCFFPRPR